MSIATIFGKIKAGVTEVASHLIWPFYRPASKGSFGRLWTSILLFCALYKYWVIPAATSNPPESMLDMIKLFLLYVFGNKGFDLATAKLLPQAKAEPAKPQAAETAKTEVSPDV